MLWVHQIQGAAPVERKEGVPQCSPPPGAPHLRACLHTLLWNSAVVVLRAAHRCGFLCLIVRCVLQPCVCLSLRGSASLVRNTFLSLFFNKHLVSKVGFANKVCNFPRQIVHLWNTIWLNIPTQCPESRRIVFLNRSDPCGRCGSQLSVVWLTKSCPDPGFTSCHMALVHGHVTLFLS